MAEQSEIDAVIEQVQQGKLVDNNTGSKNAPGSWETVTLLERPAEIPEKFFKDGVLNVKELAKSYSELESAKGKQTGQESTPKQGVEPQTQQTQQQAQSTIPGVDATAAAKYNGELAKDGKLSDGSYAELAKLGYPKAVVDSYIKGLTADQDREQAVSDARIADKQIAEIKGAIGGDAVLANMLAWAKANLDPSDLKTYNDSVSSKDVAKVKLAVNGLFHAYSQSQDPSLIQGDRSPHLIGVEPFADNDEVVKAMADPRYDKSEAYRQEVANRLRVSDLFGQSRDFTKVNRYE